VGTVKRRSLAVVAITATALTLVAVPPGDAAATCAPVEPVVAGGEWRSYGHDLSNTRTQPDETTIGPANAGSLEMVWMHAGGAAYNNSRRTTPTAASGCGLDP
jgi:polyvinyl alcohol dehydrogenase (cytochrome)